MGEMETDVSPFNYVFRLKRIAIISIPMMIAPAPPTIIIENSSGLDDIEVVVVVILVVVVSVMMIIGDVAWNDEVVRL